MGSWENTQLGNHHVICNSSMTWLHWGVQLGNAKRLPGIRWKQGQEANGSHGLQGMVLTASASASAGVCPSDQAGLASRANSAPGKAAGNTAL